MNGKEGGNKILTALFSLRRYFIQAILFSCFANILSLALPIYLMQVLDRVLGSSSIETLIWLSIIIFASVYAMNIISDVRNSVLEHIGNRVHAKLLDATLSRTVRDSVQKNVGSEYIRDLSQIKNFLHSTHFVAIIDIPWAIIFLSVIFYIHWVCGLFILTASIILMCLAFVNQKLTMNKLEKINAKEALLANKLQVFARNFESILSMGMLTDVFAHYKREILNTSNAKKEALKHVKLVSAITKVFRYLVQILVTFISAILIIKGSMSSGGMIAVSILASKVLAPFDLSAAIIATVASVRKAYHNLTNVLSQNEKTHRLSLPAPTGLVTLENVVYYINNKPIIKGISFTANAGEVIGIIGKSGSGKTTLIRLLTGILRQSRGNIKIDGADISLWNDEELGKFIGYLPQNFELLPVSIKQNISRMQACATDEAIIEAAKLANVHDLILSFEQGYETIISDTNFNLSAGQRQRIALARCFYGNSKIVILDEPNSNLDLDGEKALLSAVLNAKAKGKTVFMISHKPGILSITDKILVIHDGGVQAFDERDKVLKAIGTA